MEIRENVSFDNEPESNSDDPAKMNMAELLVASKRETNKAMENAKPDDTVDTSNKYSLEIEKREALRIAKSQVEGWAKLKKYQKKGFGS